MEQLFPSSSILVHPAHLWIGPKNKLIKEIELFFIHLFCTQQCGNCILCIQIKTKQHASITWLDTEKQYTLTQLDIIHHELSFLLEEDAYKFFVIQNADRLSDICSNSLLKAIEEPPRGNYFFFLASRLDGILDTIQSRCLMRKYNYEQDHSAHPLFPFLTMQNRNIMAFDKLLENSKINTQESIDLLDHVITHWITLYKKPASTLAQHSLQKIEHITDFLLKKSITPPMPGSSVIFWRNIMLELYHIYHELHIR